MLLSILYLLLSFLPTTESRNLESGIYVISEAQYSICDKSEPLMNTGIRYCMAEMPILGLDDIVAIGSIEANQAQSEHRFKILLTDSGNEKIQSLNELMPTSQLGFVVDDKLVAVLPLGKSTHIRDITIWKEDSMWQLKKIHRNLQAELLAIR